MYSVLLVEDEKVELDTLHYYVDWEKCGIDRVYTARGPRSALACINENEPDIMVTDIQMPGMTGIELAKLVNDEGHNCKIIFLTGFDRFDYAKEAISLHAEDFLLKPFQTSEVEELMERLVKKIEAERHEQKLKKMAIDRVIEKACRGTLSDPEEASLVYFKKPASQLHFHMFGITGLTEEQEAAVADMEEVLFSFQMSPFCMVILQDTILPKNLEGRIRGMFPDKKLQMVRAEKTIRITELYETANQIFRCKEDLFYAEPGTSINMSEHASWMPYTDRIESMEEKIHLAEVVLMGDNEKAQSILMQCLDQLTGLQQEACCQNAFSLFLYLHKTMEKKGGMDEEAGIPNIIHAQHYTEVKDNMSLYVEQCCRFCRMFNEARISYFVKKYIEMHYMEVCTVEEMADQLNLSPNYMRKKFKEETGVTILEYLTNERMTQACSRLKDPSKRVKDVSVEVGYENISYFTQIFSKRFGITPNEYRKLHG